MTGFVDKAQDGWRGEPPEWVLVLAGACDARSQNAVAAELNVNAAYLSYAIRNQSPRYHGMTEAAVRARMMGETLPCPVLGDIALDRCRALRRDRSRPMGPVQRQLRATCPTCTFNDQEDQ